ncbi:hypothetical protein FDI21_gp288 [Pseudomonas phage Noxifer]|uniref:Uncharacterized protein n=1 Tax=Pseudomonas phage Noxifer TaxID=2006684 RepID=A0A1Y0T058_9CAUD|nr:hypothetical protein FDI21_gp288 [Pseudomonas phage Noxifer]ARV77423.1 hypothetical protein NOXIFER_258 [Pseudomonas phage Noxifer]
MSAYTYTSVQLMAESDEAGLLEILALADSLGLQHTGVIHLPHNGNRFAVIMPSGSKAHWPDEAVHLTNTKRIIDAVEAYNVKEGGAFIKALQTTVMENEGAGDRYFNRIDAFVGNTDYVEE